MKERSILKNYLLAVVFLYPLFFFPLLRDSFVLSKNFFLIAASFLGLIIWLASLWQEKEVKVYVSKLDGFFLILSLFLSGYLFFLAPGNRYEALIAQPGIGTVWSLSIFYFLLGQAGGGKRFGKLIYSLGWSAALISLVNIILFVLPQSAFPLRLGGENSPLVIGGPLWSPLGSSLESLWLLIPLFVFLLTKLVRRVNREGILNDWLTFTLSVVILIGLGAAGYQLVQLKLPWLGYRTSWVVAAEGFKRQPFFGLGPGRFSEAFIIFKPASFNASQWWATRFTRSTGFYFQWWTETGLAGLVLLGWLLRHLTKRAKTGLVALKNSWLVLLILPLFLPSASLFLFMLVFWASLIEKRKEVTLPSPALAVKIISGLTALLVLVAGYFTFRSLSGEYLFYKFVRGIAAGSAQDRNYYQAVRKAPLAADFRLFRSQIDISVLNNMLNNAAQENQTLTDEQRTQLSLLAEEAIAEAKAAAALRPANVVAWENLAQVYRSLINLAEGADQWAVSAYLQAVSLDSTNPRLRTDLGGLYYSLGNYEAAARQFEVAVNLKRDYANGWYNWAWSLKQQEKLGNAVNLMQQAVFLVEANTPDYQKAQGELEEWRKELGEAQAAAAPVEGPQELIPPQPLPSPQIEEPIRLPEEAAPELEITPEPEITPEQEE